jgi:mannose-1-phosphate guanylyltransferase
MIERVVASLGASGVTEAVLALGYRPDAFTEAYPDGRCAGVKLTYAVEPEPLDTAGAIGFAARHAGIDDTFVVVNGDVLTDLDVAALFARHRAVGAEGTIALTPVDDPSRYGVVPTDADGRVLGFIEKPPRDEAPTNWINAGTYVLEPSVLDRIPGDRKVSVERETFPAMVLDGGLYALQSDVYWVDAGTPATYLQVQLDLIKGRRGAAAAGVPAAAAVPGTAIVESSVIGAGAVVEAGAVVRDSVVMAGARIGSGAHVVESIVASGAHVGAGAKLTDLTVVGDDQTVEPGASHAGDRIPEGA